MTAPVSQVLSEAADLLAPEGAWTQHAYARDIFGDEVAMPSDAVCFCAVGAIDMACNHPTIGAEAHPEAICVLAQVVTGNQLGSIPSWNDAPERTQEEVAAAFRCAAALAKEQGR